jgi:hypothetical protein
MDLQLCCAVRLPHDHPLELTGTASSVLVNRTSVGAVPALER